MISSAAAAWRPPHDGSRRGLEPVKETARDARNRLPQEPPGEDITRVMNSGEDARERHSSGERVERQPQFRDLPTDNTRERGRRSRMPGWERRRTRLLQAPVLGDRAVRPPPSHRLLHRDVRNCRRRRDRCHRRDRCMPPPRSSEPHHQRNRDPESRVRRGFGERRKYSVEQRRLELGNALEHRDVDGLQPAAERRFLDTPRVTQGFVSRTRICDIRHRGSLSVRQIPDRTSDPE